jgi:hypothetical protein
MIFLQSGALETKVRSSAIQKLTEHITWVTATYILCDRAVTVSADVACTHTLASKLAILDTCFMLCIMAETNTILSASARSSQLITAKAQTILVTPSKLINNFDYEVKMYIYETAAAASENIRCLR